MLVRGRQKETKLGIRVRVKVGKIYRFEEVNSFVFLRVIITNENNKGAHMNASFAKGSIMMMIILQQVRYLEEQK